MVTCKHGAPEGERRTLDHAGRCCSGKHKGYDDEPVFDPDGILQEASPCVEAQPNKDGGDEPCDDGADDDVNLV
jgi:hypothetical protein